jgi:hypothetical protein
VQDDLLVLGLDEVIHNMRGRRVTSRVAKPLVAVQALCHQHRNRSMLRTYLYHASRVVDTTVAARVLDIEPSTFIFVLIVTFMTSKDKII